MSAVREQFILERTVTVENGRTVLQERRIYGVLDADGTFHPRACCGKYFVIRQESGGDAKNRKTAA